MQKRRNVIECLISLALTCPDSIVERNRDGSQKWRLGNAAHRTAAGTRALFAFVVTRAARARWIVAGLRWLI